MSARRLVIIALSALAIMSARPACAIEVGSRRLIENARRYDGKVVTFRGEAVTAAMRRGDHAWLAVNDGDNALGVWCKAEMVDGVRFYGSYKAQGDRLEVTGIFNRACEEHGGELDIHADSIKIVRQGSALTETVSRKKIRLAFALFFLTIIIVIAFRKRL